MIVPSEEKLVCKLSSCLYIVWPVNGACAISVSVLILLLVMWVQTGREPCITWAIESCPSGGPYNQSANRLGNWGHQVSLVLGEVVISLSMKKIVSKSGKQILTVYRKNWFLDADSCSPCIFVIVVAVVTICFVSLFAFLVVFFFFLTWFGFQWEKRCWP